MVTIPDSKLRIPIWIWNLHLEWSSPSLHSPPTISDWVGGDDHGFRVGVVFDGLVAVLFAQTALLYAAERQFVVDDLRGVDPGVTSFDVSPRRPWPG